MQENTVHSPLSAGWSAGSLWARVGLGAGGSAGTSELVVLGTGFALCALS